MTIEDFTISILPVIAERTRLGTWLLTCARCPLCGKAHQHGGGREDEPSYGTRVAHCLPQHKAFRQDCKPERTPGGRTECRELHGGPMVQLEPLPDVTHL